MPKKTYLNSIARLLFVLFSLLLVAGSAENTAQASTQSTGLFSDAVARSAVNAPPQAVQVRTVSINMDMLGGEDGPSLAPDAVGQTLDLNLFDEVELTAQLDELNQNASGSYSWIGTIVDMPMSQAMFVVKNGVMVGVVFTENLVYEIRYVGDGVHAIMAIDQRGFIDHAPDWYQPDLTPMRLAADRIQRSIRAADDGTVIDIMVGYTSDARAAAGGTTAIENTAQLAVDSTNTAYKNSNVTQRLYLVHTEEFNYTETGNSSTDLSRWEGKSDGDMDSAHISRDTYHADLMMLLTNNGGGFCGIASLQTSFSLGFEDDAFGVTALSCAVGNLSFAHEAGHNMGLRHDWYVDSSTFAPSTAAHGFSNPADAWRTVMAYNSHCTAAGSSCTRMAYFSNTSVTFGGDVMGVAAGTSTACSSGNLSPNPTTCDADNASVLNAGDTTYAQWRSSKVTWTGAIDDDWNNSGNWEFISGTTQNGGSTSIVNRVPLTVDDVLIPSAPTGGNFPTLSSGTINARDVTVETGASLTISGGTLNVYGQWVEEGTGKTTATGGTIYFLGQIDQTISAHADSTFHSIAIGNGSTTQELTLASDLNIDGGLSINYGTKLIAGANTLNVSGDWTDASNGFVADTSTVIFDGTAGQTVKELGTVRSYLVGSAAEEFEGAFPPTGWALVDNTGNGDWDRNDQFSSANQTNGMGFSAASKSSSATNLTALDNELRSPTFTVPTTGAWVEYQSNFQDYNGNGDAYLDVSSNSGNSWTTIAQWTRDYGPTLENHSLGDYTGQTVMLRWRYTASAGSAWYWQVDDVGIYTFDYDGDIDFNNLEVASINSGATFNGKVIVGGNLVTLGGATAADSDAKANFGANDPTVEGTVTNNGKIVQTKDASAVSALVEFGRIKDTAGTTKYYGIDLTPTSAAFGSTTVEISGNSGCEIGGDTTNNTTNRCYEITPTTNGQPATIRFYYRESEINGLTYNALQIWHWDSGLLGWTGPLGTPSYSNEVDGDAAWNWVEVSGVSDFSPFAAGNQAPTAVELEYFTATVNDNHSVAIAWETSQEVDHAGFRIYRRAADSRAAWTQITSSLIASRGSQAQGAIYDYTDDSVDFGTWEYLLEDVETDGDSNPHDDFIATVLVEAPLSITLTNRSTTQPFTLLYALLAVVSLMLLTRILFRTKQR